VAGVGIELSIISGFYRRGEWLRVKTS